MAGWMDGWMAGRRKACAPELQASEVSRRQLRNVTIVIIITIDTTIISSTIIMVIISTITTIISSDPPRCRGPQRRYFCC